ncbi:MAG: hypothetical protein R2789_14880 [Microthrixaceae bacterium]
MTSPKHYKLAKQADTVMLFYVLSSEELAELWDRLGYERDPDFIRRNIEYYESRTSHGSTLSIMVHVVAQPTGPPTLLGPVPFRARIDINDVQGGTTRGEYTSVPWQARSI